MVVHYIITGIYLVKEKKENSDALVSWFSPVGNHQTVTLTSPPAAQPA